MLAGVLAALVYGFAPDLPARMARAAFTAIAFDAPKPPPPAKPEFVRAVSVQKSLSNPNVIISMIDGKPYRTLRRHLSTHGLSPEQYRERYGLKADYPMVAPNYAEKRRDLAKKIGLGRKPGAKRGGKAW